MAEEMPSELKSSVGFAVDDNKAEESSKNEKSAPKKKKSRSSSLRSSFFRLKSLSFRRSGGERGADIDTLRGTHGPDFEGYATIKRAGGGMGVSCGCFGGGNDDTKEKIILIKGAYCFVFMKESDSAPKYAISCAHMKAKIQPQSHGAHPHHVTIETSLGDTNWELGFEQEQIAQQFADAFRQQAAIGESDEVRKRLGHEQLLHKRGSVKYAEAIAQKKLDDQPEKKENVLLEDVNRIDPTMPVY